jgi:hypothetical protein
MSSGALSSVEQRKLLRMITLVILRLQSTPFPNGVTAGNCKCVTAERHEDQSRDSSHHAAISCAGELCLIAGALIARYT